MSSNFDGNRYCVSTISLFNNCMICVAWSIATISCKTENERVSFYVLQQLMIFMVVWKNLKVKYSILAGRHSNSCIIFSEILADVTNLRGWP